MNKQNKKIAQEKRRIEREKAEKKAKVVNHCFVSRMPEIPWSVMQLAYHQCPLTMNRPMSQLPRLAL